MNSELSIEYIKKKWKIRKRVEISNWGDDTKLTLNERIFYGSTEGKILDTEWSFVMHSDDNEAMVTRRFGSKESALFVILRLERQKNVEKHAILRSMTERQLRAWYARECTRPSLIPNDEGSEDEDGDGKIA